MKVSMVMVSSVNGKITKGDNPDVAVFASKEDATLFASLKLQFPVIIMGRRTYEVARANMKLQPEVLRIVMTKDPKRFISESVSGQLEFTDESPKELVGRLTKAGYETAMLAGGSEVNARFLKDQLVSELRITIEPVLLGEGKNFLAESVVDIPMKLVSTRQLNVRGSMHMIYEVIR